MNKFKIFLVALLGTVAFSSPALAGPVVPILVGAAIGAGAAALGFIGVSVLTAAAIGAAVGAVAGSLAGDLMGGFDTPDYNVTQNAQAVNDGILVNQKGMLEEIPIVYGQRKVGGKIVFLATGGDRNKFLYLAVVLSEGEIDSINEVYVDEVLSTDSRFSGRLQVQKFTGADNQTASSLLQEANGWTANHRLRGLAYLAVRAEWKKIEDQDDADANPFSGIPKIQAVIKGKKVKSAASAGSATYANETGLAFSNNPADCLLDYLRNDRYGRGLENDRIDFTSFSTARSKFNETVTYATGVSGKPVTCDAVIDSGRTIFDNTKLFLANMRSGMPYIQGKFTLKLQDGGNSSTGQSTTPTVTTFNTTSGDVDETLIIGGIKMTGSGIKDQYNQVKLTYVDPTNEWKTNEVIVPAVNSARDQELLAEDNNRRLIKEMTFNHIINKNVAADLAHIILEQSRKRKHIEFTATAELHNAIVSDIIRVTYAPLSIASALFRVTSLKLNNDYTVTVTASEHTPADYVFEDNNAIYGSENQKKYVGNGTRGVYFFWNGSEFETANTPAATSNDPTLPSIPSSASSTDLAISSITEVNKRDNPSNPTVLVEVQFVMSNRIKDTSRLITLEKLDPATNTFKLEFSVLPNTIQVVSGTTHKFRTIVPLNGATQIFRIKAQLNDEDALPSARFSKAISQSAFKKGVTIT